MVPGHEDQSDGHVAGDHKGGEAGEEAEEDEQAAQELRQGGDVSEPPGKPHGRDVVGEVVEGRKVVASVKATGGHDLAIAVSHHGYTEHDPHQKCAPGLEVVQGLGHHCQNSVHCGVQWEFVAVGS